jgi:hypothetical protein
MSQLVLSAIPDFSDLADASIAAGKVVTDDTMRKMSHNAKFATVRGKLIFVGFYAHGNIVPTPIDPDDGYAYSRAECQFIFMPFSNRAPASGMIPGQVVPPPQSNSQPGPLYNWPGGWDINDVTGLVTLWTSYYAHGTETVNNDGIIKVYAVCRRSSLTSRPGPPAPPAPTPPLPPVAANIFRPTQYLDQGPTPTLNPAAAYDLDPTSFAQVIGLPPYYAGVCLWYGFPSPAGPKSAMSLSIYTKQIISGGVPSGYPGGDVGIVEYLPTSVGPNAAWHTVRYSAAGWDASVSPDVISLPIDEDLSTTMVRVTQTPPASGVYIINVYDIVVTVTP